MATSAYCKINSALIYILFIEFIEQVSFYRISSIMNFICCLPVNAIPPLQLQLPNFRVPIVVSPSFDNLRCSEEEQVRIHQLDSSRRSYTSLHQPYLDHL